MSRSCQIISVKNHGILCSKIEKTAVFDRKTTVFLPCLVSAPMMKVVLFFGRRPERRMTLDLWQLYQSNQSQSWNFMAFDTPLYPPLILVTASIFTEETSSPPDHFVMKMNRNSRCVTFGISAPMLGNSASTLRKSTPMLGGIEK